MAITARQAKIYALRYMRSQCEDMFQSGHPSLSESEQDDITYEMDKLIEALSKRIERLGDNSNSYPWDGEHVKNIFKPK